MKPLWRVVLLLQCGQGALNGLFLYTWGPYFYDRFSVTGSVQSALVIVMVLFALRQALVALMEVPVGALADTIGRSRVVMLSFAVRCAFFLSMVALAFCDTLFTAVFWAGAASLCYAAGYTLFNGAFSAWCAEAMRACAPDVPYSWMAARYMIYQSIGEMAGAVLAILLYLHGMPFGAFLCGAAVAYGLMAVGISRMAETRAVAPVEQSPRYDLATLVRMIGLRIADSVTVVRQLPVMLWVTLTYGAFMFLMSLVLHLWPIYLREIAGAQQLGPAWVGIALLCLVILLASAKGFAVVNDRLILRAAGNQARFAMYRWVLSGAATLSALSVGCLSSVTAFAGEPPLGLLIFAIGSVLCSAGIIMSCYDIVINSLIGPECAADRATILSGGSMVRSLLTLLLAVPAGGISAEHSPMGWSIPAVILGIAGLMAHRALGDHARGRGATTDRAESPGAMEMRTAQPPEG
ncbi:MAG: hypothetical protein HYV02_02870 [Deltaproteobacteria bacterium]|nr:hypothetical protein [Deltaproteobacteria bacterium]